MQQPTAVQPALYVYILEEKLTDGRNKLVFEHDMVQKRILGAYQSIEAANMAAKHYVENIVKAKVRQCCKDLDTNVTTTKRWHSGGTIWYTVEWGCKTDMSIRTLKVKRDFNVNEDTPMEILGPLEDDKDTRIPTWKKRTGETMVMTRTTAMRNSKISTRFKDEHRNRFSNIQEELS